MSMGHLCQYLLGSHYQSIPGQWVLLQFQAMDWRGGEVMEWRIGTASRSFHQWAPVRLM